MKATEAADRSYTLIQNADYDGMLQLLLQEPNNVAVLYNAGIAYQALGNTDNAVKCWKKALTIDEEPEVLRALAYHYAKSTKTLDQAADMLEILDDNDDVCSEDMALLATIYAKKGKFEDAHYCFVDGIDLDPDNANAYTQHAVLHARWALQQLNEAKKRGPINPEDLPEEPELRFVMQTLASFNACPDATVAGSNEISQTQEPVQVTC